MRKANPESQPFPDTLLLTNGNDCQTLFAVRLFQQIYASDRGNYKGAFQFVSDKLSERSKPILKHHNEPFRILEKDCVRSLNQQFRSDKHPLAKLPSPRSY